MKIIKVLAELHAEDTAHLRKNGTIAIPEEIDEIGNGVFGHCLNLREITIPKNIKRIDRFAFYNCHNLKTITFCSVPDIDEKAFHLCSGVEKIVFSQDVLVTLEYTPKKVQQFIEYLKEIINRNTKIEIQDDKYIYDEIESE